MMAPPRRLRTAALSARLALASLGTAIAIGVVCAVGLSSLENTAAVTRVAVTQQLALIDDAAAMSAFQYQKGFVAEYLLSGNPAWLTELKTSRPAFESWLASAHAKVANPGSGKLLDDIQSEYAAYDRARKTAIALHDSGKSDEATMALEATTPARSACADLFHEFGGWRARTPSGRWPTPRRSVRRLGHVLVGTSIAGAHRQPARRLLVGAPDHEADLRAARSRSNRRPSGRGSRSRPAARARGAGRSGRRAGREAGGDRRRARRAPAAADAEREAVGGRRAGGQARARGPEPARRHEGGRAAPGPPGRRARGRGAR